MHHTTPPSAGAPFPDDDLRRLLRHLVRTAGLLEPKPTAHGLGELTVSMSELFALGELSETPSLSQQELADRLGLEKSTVSRLAAGLEARGWLTRQRSAGNRRFYRLQLSERGHQAARQIGQHMREYHDRLLSHLTPEERQALAMGLTALFRAIAHGAEVDQQR